jgi:hypothetical protein
MVMLAPLLMISPGCPRTGAGGCRELHGHSGRVLMIGFTADPDVLISAAAAAG